MDNNTLLTITFQIKQSLQKINAYKAQTNHIRKFVNDKRKELENPTQEEESTLCKLEEDLVNMDIICDTHRLELEDKIDALGLGHLFNIAETLTEFNI